MSLSLSALPVSELTLAFQDVRLNSLARFRHAYSRPVHSTTPFHPAYVTADLIKKAKNLKACITAGVGSDHVDLNAGSFIDSNFAG